MNEFSMICRILGSLFYRQPEDPVLAPLFTLIKEGQLITHWPLEQDVLLARLQQSVDLHQIEQDYRALFIGNDCYVPLYRSEWQIGSSEHEIREFLEERGMPQSESRSDNFGVLLLAASWLEEQSQEDEYKAQVFLFDNYILPWAGQFLGKVEACATSVFYRTLALITREALQAMRDELQESEDDD